MSLIGQSVQPLTVNDQGQITYSQVVKVEEVGKELLFSNTYAFLESLVDEHKRLKKGPYVNEDSTEIYLPLAYTVYKDFPVHSPHGVIKYQFKVSIKEGRYRYIATNFVFHYLERNRYGKFVEVKGKSKPLETQYFKGSQKLWDQHKLKTAEKVNTLAENLQAEIYWRPEGPKQEIVKVNESW